MNEIDWSKAPEWATHALEKLHEPDRNLVYWSFFVDGEHRVEPNGLWYHPDGYRIIQSRPTNQSWYGEGLPPAGADIEVKHELYGWIGARVVGQDGEAAIVRTNDGYAGVFPHQMRPIRTTEQIAADDREAAILDMERICRSGDFGSGGLAALYDAGYRKP